MNSFLFPEGFDATTTTAAATQDPGMMQQIKDAFKSVPKELANKFSDPKQLAGSVSKNGVQYILEPLVENGFLFGLSLYSSFTDKSGSN